MSPGPIASSPDSGGRQSQSARGAVAGNPAGAVATSPSQQARQVQCEQPLLLATLVASLCTTLLEALQDRMSFGLT